MLHWFRTSKQAYFYSAFLIIFAILVEILIPVAHAAGNNQKSFLAAICTGDQLVYVNVSVDSNETVATNTNDGKQCPLCFLVEQDAIVLSGQGTSLYFPSTVVHDSPDYLSPSTHALRYVDAIRAPPIIS